MKIPAIMLIFIAFVVVAPKGLRASHHSRSPLIPGSSYFLIARHRESQSFARKMWNVAPQDQPVGEFWFGILLGPFTQHRSIQTQFFLNAGSDGHHEVLLANGVTAGQQGDRVNLMGLMFITVSHFCRFVRSVGPTFTPSYPVPTYFRSLNTEKVQRGGSFSTSFQKANELLYNLRWSSQFGLFWE